MTFFNPTPGSHLSTLIQFSKIFEKKPTAAHEFRGGKHLQPPSFRTKIQQKWVPKTSKSSTTPWLSPQKITGSKPIQRRNFLAKLSLKPSAEGKPTTKHWEPPGTWRDILSHFPDPPQFPEPHREVQKMRDTVLGQGWGKYLEHLFGVLNEWVPGCPWVPINQPLGSYWHLLGGAGRCVFFFQPFVTKDCK